MYFAINRTRLSTTDAPSTEYSYGRYIRYLSTFYYIVAIILIKIPAARLTCATKHSELLVELSPFIYFLGVIHVDGRKLDRSC